MRAVIERNFTLLLCLGIVAGLYMPGLDSLPPYSPLVVIACVMFFSCSRASLEELRGFNKRSAAIFAVVRFFMLPAVLYHIALLCVPHYALGVLLVALMPVGVASSAMANLTGGNVSLSLSATVLSNGLTPFIVPLMLLLLSGNDVALDARSLFTTLALSVFVPAALYFFVARRSVRLTRVIVRESQAVSTVLLSVMAALVIALQRRYIFDYPQEVMLALSVALTLFALLYAFGWFYATPMGERDKKNLRNLLRMQQHCFERGYSCATLLSSDNRVYRDGRDRVGGRGGAV